MTTQHLQPPLPSGPAATEERRQRAVETLPLRQDAPNDRLDRVTRMARLVLGAPASTITVIDGDRAWFPSAQGFPATPVARDETFCDRTHAEDRTIVVADARDDPGFASHVAVRDGIVRFYAGRPLHDHLGNVVGTFCVFGPEPRVLDDEELVTFHDLAAWAEQELVASSEMVQAGRVQASLLPARPIRVDGWTVDGLCLPALSVGGDFYDYGLADGVLHLALGDVMGKGTGAALVGAGVRAALRGVQEAVVAGVDLGITATQVARALLPDLERAESFVTLLEAAIDLEDGVVRYVDAGSGLALLVRRDGTYAALASDDRPFGVLPDDHWSEHELEFAPGDRLLLFSDGLLDLLDVPTEWAREVAGMMHAAADGPEVLHDIAELARLRTPLDDVTAVLVARGADA